MTSTSLDDHPPEFWEEVGHDYFTGVPLRVLTAKHGLKLSQFNTAQAEFGWRRRRTLKVSRERLVRRMFLLLDTSVSEMEAQMRPAPLKKGEAAPPPPPPAKTHRDVILLNRMATALGRLMELDTTATAKKRPRHSRQILDVRDKLVKRIAELKRD